MWYIPVCRITESTVFDRDELCIRHYCRYRRSVLPVFLSDCRRGISGWRCGDDLDCPPAQRMQEQNDHAVVSSGAAGICAASTERLPALWIWSGSCAAVLSVVPENASSVPPQQPAYQQPLQPPSVLSGPRILLLSREFQKLRRGRVFRCGTGRESKISRKNKCGIFPVFTPERSLQVYLSRQGPLCCGE